MQSLLFDHFFFKYKLNDVAFLSACWFIFSLTAFSDLNI